MGSVEDASERARPGQPLRILDLISVEGAGGGAEKIVLRTAARANPNCFRSTVCGLRCAGDPAYDLDVRAAKLGIDYCEVVTRSKFDRGLVPALRKIIRERNIDIIHAHGYKSAYCAARLARLESVLPMSTSHGWTGRHWRERFLYYPADKLIIRTFPVAIAVSSQIRDVLVRWGCRPERIRVVLNGIDPAEYRRDPEIVARARGILGVAPDEVALGGVGRLEPQKRFDILIDAVKQLLPSHPRLKLFIAGEGSLKAALQRRIDGLGLSGCCKLLGHRTDVRELYQGFDVLVQSSDYEGTPTVVLEAMALEVPLVATDAGGTRELVEHGVHALVVPIRSPNALAAAMDEVLRDTARTAQRVAASRQRVETDLSFQHRLGKLEKIYRDLIASRATT